MYIGKLVFNSIGGIFAHWKIRNIKSVEEVIEEREKGKGEIERFRYFKAILETQEGEKEVHLVDGYRKIAIIYSVINILLALFSLLFFYFVIYRTIFLISVFEVIYGFVFLMITSPIPKIRLENPAYALLAFFPMIAFALQNPIGIIAMAYKSFMLAWFFNTLIFLVFLIKERRKVYKIFRIKEGEDYQYPIGIFAIYAK